MTAIGTTPPPLAGGGWGEGALGGHRPPPPIRLPQREGERSSLDLAALLPRLSAAIRTAPLRPLHGRVERVVGAMIEARLGGVRVGELCQLRDPSSLVMQAEVAGVADRIAYLTPLGTVAGLSASTEVEPLGRCFTIPAGEGLLGRVLDGVGRPLDRTDDPPACNEQVPVDSAAPPPLDRAPLQRSLPLGVRAFDALLTCAEGSRIGIFGPPGAGKSSLIARIVRAAAADVFVVALVGERGREVGEFLRHQLGPDAQRRTVVVVATSDRPAFERVKAAQVATAIAEWFRDSGRRVVLLVDSLTRLARAWREIGLAIGEPPTRRGFPPSVFAALPRLLERAASGPRGSITGFYTILVEGDPASDPIAEEVKAILDGHVMLSDRLAAIDHHPAIDVLASRSRVMDTVAKPAHRAAAGRLRQLLARYADIELLVRVGEYRPGSDALADESLRKIDSINAFLRQGDDMAPFEQTLATLQELTA